jgi:predicted ATP-dependent serine protease
MQAEPPDFYADAPPHTDDDAPGGWRPRIVDNDVERSAIAEEPAKPPAPLTVLDVLEQWRKEGPLVHEPTGIAKLDDLTGGGPVYGSRIYLLGAPDAGKTGLLVQLLHTWAQRGIMVGILAVDEEPSDIVTRLAQRAGWQRSQCEVRDSMDIDAMADALRDLPVKLYSYGWTIESASKDLADRAKAENRRAVFFVDSIQAVASYLAAAAESPREVVSANVAALRACASAYKLIAIATSEMSRGAYRSVQSAEQTDDMAAGKESGAIEYSARIMLALRSVKGDGEKVHVKIAKNKHGPTGELWMALDRRAMTFTECAKPEEQSDEEREEAKTAVREAKLERLMVELEKALVRAKNPPTTRQALKGLISGRNDDIEAAISRLQRDERIEGGKGAPFRVVSTGSS